MDGVGATAVTIDRQIRRRRIPALTMVLIAVGGADGRAQGAWPGQTAPIPGLVGTQGRVANNGGLQIGAAMAPFPPTGGLQDRCTADFHPLREEAERRGKLIKDAGQRHATPDEACGLIRSFGQSEIKMITFIEAHPTQCWHLAQVAVELRRGHQNTDRMQTKVCAMVGQRQPAGPVGDFDFPSIH
jgi:hypothetical protein